MDETLQNGELPSAGVDDSPLSAAITQRDQDTITMVENALHGGDVVLAYQPVVSATSGKPVFYEGLIRILDKSGRAIPARDFIETVETRESGRQIDCAALKLGLRALAKAPTLRLSINMSARSIGYPRWTRILEAGLKADPTIAERLILEITESSAMTMPELVVVFMRKLHQRGVSFAIDDFGAGYTSFRYLREFYFDILKIDGQFMRGIETNPDNQVLTAALISIAQHFDMFTVAESVETAGEAEFLRQAGIDCMQGYYLGAPSINAPLTGANTAKKIA